MTPHDDPLIETTLLTRADAEPVGHDFGDTMLDAVRAGARRRRARRWVAASTVSVATASALALALVPGVALGGGGASSAAGPTATGEPTMPTSDVGDAPLERAVLGLPVGPLPPRDRAEIRRDGAQPTVRYPDGRTVTLPAGTGYVDIVADGASGTLIRGSAHLSGTSATMYQTNDNYSYAMLIPPGATAGITLRLGSPEAAVLASPDGTQALITLEDGRHAVVRLTDGTVLRTVSDNPACSDDRRRADVWAPAGIVWECQAISEGGRAVMQLRSAQDGALLNTWTQPRSQIDWLAVPGSDTVLVWNRDTEVLSKVDPRTGAATATLTVPGGRYTPVELSPDGRRLVAANRIVDVQTLKFLTTLRMPSSTDTWTWQNNTSLMDSVHIRRYLGENGEALETGEKRDDHFYWVVCPADGSQCHRLPTDPKQSHEGQPTLTS